MNNERHHEEIHVTVVFPISKRGPYQSEVSPQATVGTVLNGAMEHFVVQNDTQFTYVLVHDRQEQESSITVGTIAGDARSVHFTLVKKLTQG